MSTNDLALAAKAPVVVAQASGPAQPGVATQAVVEVPAKGKGGFSSQVSVGELIEFQFTGLLVVFVVLGGLTLVCALIARMLKLLAPDHYYCRVKAETPVTAAPATPVVAPAAPVAAATIHPGMPDERLLAIIAVAVQETLGPSATIVKFRRMDSMDWTWSVQGRVGIHNSHNL